MNFSSSIDSYEENVSLRNVTQLNTYVTFPSKIHDTLTNLDLEVRYIWKEPWNCVKVLYLWTRYATYANPIVGLVYRIDTFGIVVSEHSNEIKVVLGVRTWALWRQSRKVATIIMAVYTCKIVVVIFLMNRFLQETTITSVPGHPGCFVIGNGVLLRVVWSTILFAESVWITFMVVKFFHDCFFYYVLLSVLVIVVIAPRQSTDSPIAEFNFGSDGCTLHTCTHYVLRVHCSPDDPFKKGSRPRIELRDCNNRQRIDFPRGTRY
ncbi:hypothetical protein CONPUDRAFT_75839 [Coniophora puteana RWD-64-598 SS2]|uniref:DUF6533 domain-containing protein n=1 Tax=Coniophora puteana (strain RWD-64-598) TaxID=741705 RepID=A0A5M3MDQ5_CONPW|nr:uncharacterized protein CONPUDRAFT_75839 [Coniophora puteana RWD-64-598 SS2]EIW77010.1 hypothetical protein CONPUDRAFT_75839 [Coniophora puteana RWD-64-598 SS2]